LSQATDSQEDAFELAHMVTLAFVVIAVLRARCMDETKSLIAPVCFEFIENICNAGIATDISIAATASTNISSMSVNPVSLFMQFPFF
jgi:hypothetical protein